jgi:dihydrofolate reductase
VFVARMKGETNMRNIISLAHISLDGFMATKDGDFRFIRFDKELANDVYPSLHGVETSVYGRITYQLMQGYWPTAGDAPDADTNTKAHARWYNGVNKIVASRTITSNDPKVRVAGDNIVDVLRAEKQKPGGDIMIFASPTLTHTLHAAGLVDEWRLTLQPVFIGEGLPLFANLEKRAELELRWSKTYKDGVIAAHYVTKR